MIKVLEAVKVLTDESLERIFAEGGSGTWRASAERIAKASYVICVRNTSVAEEWVAHDEYPQGTAFLVGRRLSTIPVPEKERLIIAFEEYAMLNIPNSWDGSRNPVAYFNANDLDINWESLHWQKFPVEKIIHDLRVRPLTITEAKNGIAKSLGINPELIEITIRT